MLLICCYNRLKSLVSSHLDYLNNIWDNYCKSYENLILQTTDDIFMIDFFQLNDLLSLIDKGWVTYRFSYIISHNDAGGWGRGAMLSLMTFWNSEKLLKFKAHKLS